MMNDFIGNMNDNPLWLFFGILIGVVGSDGIWAVVGLVRKAVVNRKAKRIQKKRREEYGVMFDNALRQGCEITLRTEDRTVYIKSGKNGWSDEIEDTAPRRTSCEPMDEPKEDQ